MLFAWLRRRRREKVLAASYPPEWRATFRALPHIGLLPQADAERLFAAARIFIAEKTWEGCGGLELTDDMRHYRRLPACLPTLGIPTSVSRM
ncbi:MAG: zinc-dependent peptidase [Gemmataceae bacterium]